MSAIETEGSHIPDQLVEQLLKGYEALAYEVKSLNEQRRELENKVSWAKQQYLDVLRRFSPDSASKDFHTFLGELDEAAAVQQEKEVDWLEALAQSGDGDKRTRAYNIQRADDAREKVRYRQRLGDNAGTVQIMNGKHAEKFPMEQDFTTRGTPGRLGCPYAASRGAAFNGHRGVSTPRSSISRGSISGRRSKRASFHDPIRAETCGNQPMSPAISVDGSLPLCPIRFLDQHSPEEVASYFEKHKHEIPRSHETCIKRIQDNEDALHSLDSKFSNVVSLVKELSHFHKPMLPDPDEIAVDETEESNSAAAKVENWAKDVRSTEEPNDVTAEQDDSEERESRFDRDLKDVRLGESPSRPWGIPVPEQDDDAASQKSDPTASPLDPSSAAPASPEAAAKGCPFSHLIGSGATAPHPIEPTSLHPASVEEEQKVERPLADAASKATDGPPSDSPGDPPTEQSIPKKTLPASAPAVSQMVFNGPVFIGYPVDQALAFLKQAGLQHPHPQ